MAPRIGYISFKHLRGEVFPLATQLEGFTRPGIDGSGSINLGQRAKESSLESTQYYSTRALASSAKDDYYALQGDEVSMVDEDGRYWSRVEVTEVTVEPIKDLAYSTTGAKAKMKAKWIVKVLA